MVTRGSRRSGALLVPGLLLHDLRRSAVRNLERAGISHSVDEAYRPQDRGLRETVEYMGYEASTAASGSQAIAGMATIQPHVVFLDLMMPGSPASRR